MAWQAKWTAKRGDNDLKEVTLAAGSAESHSDTISVNMDVTAMTKGDALMQLESIKQKIHAGPWPPL